MELGGLKFIPLEGTPRENGASLGRQFAPAVRAHASLCAEQLKKTGARELVKSITERLSELCPELLEELNGRAEGAGIEPDSCILSLCREPGGSTDVLCAAGGEAVMAHNEDGAYTLSSLGVVCEKRGGKMLCYLFTPFHPAACTFGWTSHFVFSVNAIRLLSASGGGIPAHFALRSLASSESMAQLRERLKTTGVGGAFSLNLYDLAERRMYNVERRLDVTQITELLGPSAHANHLQYLPDPESAELPGPASPSFFRAKKAASLLSEPPRVTADRAARIMEYEGSDGSILLRGGDGPKTAMTFIFDSKSGLRELRCRLNGRVYRLSPDMSRIESEPMPQKNTEISALLAQSY